MAQAAAKAQVAYALEAQYLDRRKKFAEEVMPAVEDYHSQAQVWALWLDATGQLTQEDADELNALFGEYNVSWADSWFELGLADGRRDKGGNAMAAGDNFYADKNYQMALVLYGDAVTEFGSATDRVHEDTGVCYLHASQAWERVAEAMDILGKYPAVPKGGGDG
jgi:hypothetical protein